MKVPDLRIDGAELGRILTYCVYAWRRGNGYLYVGVSSNGLARPFNHSVIGVREEVRDTDTIDVWFFKTWRTAEKREAAMIRKHQPTYNVAGNPGHVKNQKRYACAEKWQAHYRERAKEQDIEEIGWSERSPWTGEVPLV